MASVASQRQMVVPEISATRPRVSTSARMSGTNRRDSGRPRRLGSSQAIALTSMATSGGEGRGSSTAGAFLQAGQTLEVEAFAPLGDDLSAGVQPGGDLVVVQAVCGHEHDLGTDHVSIRQRIAAGLGFQDFEFLLAEVNDVRALPGHGFPLSGRTVPPIPTSTYVTVLVWTSTKRLTRSSARNPGAAVKPIADEVASPVVGACDHNDPTRPPEV